MLEGERRKISSIRSNGSKLYRNEKQRLLQHIKVITATHFRSKNKHAVHVFNICKKLIKRNAFAALLVPFELGGAFFFLLCVPRSGENEGRTERRGFSCLAEESVGRERKKFLMKQCRKSFDLNLNRKKARRVRGKKFENLLERKPKTFALVADGEAKKRSRRKFYHLDGSG